MSIEIRDAGDVYERGLRLAALLVVATGKVTQARLPNQATHWKVDGARVIGGSSLDHSLWWLREAGFVVSRHITEGRSASAVLLTERGRAELGRAIPGVNA